MKSLSLILQTDYNSVFTALCSETAIIEVVQESKITASSRLICNIVSLLEKHQVSWNDLSFMGVNQGPGPFTTLRVIISTLNGLAFARNIPLIGVDGLAAFLQDVPSQNVSIVLFNAFAQDVYFGIKQGDEIIAMGWQNIDLFLQKLQNDYAETSLVFFGNGTILFEEKIKNTFKNNAIISSSQILYTSMQAIVTAAYAQWNKRITHTSLLPLYLKTMDYKAST